MQAAAQELKIHGRPENLALRTVRQDVKIINGTSISFTISPACQPHKVFKIHSAFTADHLGLAEHTCPAATLQRKYRHLRGLPIPSFDSVQPLLLIGSDYPHLVIPIEPVCLGPPGGPAAKTRLGWTVQGPAKLVKHQLLTQQCLNISILSPSNELLRHIEKLWQLDVLPYRSEKFATRSKQDQEAIDLLEAKTTRINVNGTQRYATPLLRVKDMPKLHARKQAVMPNLRSTETRLAKDPFKSEAYRAEIQRLKQAGYVVEVPEQEIMEKDQESWFIPHHMVSHNGKNRVVFNCSFSYRGKNLNNLLLPGPALGSSLLGVLLRFREHAVAFSSDIKACSIK